MIPAQSYADHTTRIARSLEKAGVAFRDMRTQPAKKSDAAKAVREMRICCDALEEYLRGQPSKPWWRFW